MKTQGICDKFSGIGVLLRHGQNESLEGSMRMRFNRVRLWGLGMMLGCSVMVAQPDMPNNVESDSTFLAVLSQTPEANPAAGQFIDSLLLVAQSTDDCLLYQVASAIYVKRNKPDSAGLATLLNDGECKFVGYHVQYSIGVQYFLLKKYADGKEWFERALAASNLPQQQLRCHLAIGACSNELGDNASALVEFTRAHELSEPPVEPMLINNLAASQIGMGLEEEAIEMLELALQRDDLDDYTRGLLEFNRFHALASLNDLARANEAFQRIAPDLNAETLQASQFSSLIRFCLIQDSQERWLTLSPLLSAAMENIDHDLLFDEGDPTCMLFDAYSDRWEELGLEDKGDVRWRTIKNLHKNYFEGRKAYAQSLLNERNALAKVNLSPKSIVRVEEPNYLRLIGIPFLLLLLGGIGLYRWNKKQSATASADAEKSSDEAVSTLRILEQVERMIKEGDAQSDLHALIAELRSGEIEKSQARLEQLAATQKLSAMEKQALALFIHGYNGKQVAAMLDRSPGYIYNMRSKLRKLLSLQEDEDFPDWFRSHSGKSN